MKMKLKAIVFGIFLTLNMVGQDIHLSKLKNAMNYTLQVAEAMPVDGYEYKPTEDQLTFKEQLIHVGENLYWLSAVYLREVDNPVKSNKVVAEEMSKDEVITWVLGAYEYAMESIIGLTEVEMVKEFPWRDGLKMNKGQFINLIHDHQTHHRGQMIVYLRMNHVIPPKYVGW